MKEEGNLVKDKIDNAQSKEETKSAKYTRIAVAYIAGALILIVIVAAIVRKYWG